MRKVAYVVSSLVLTACGGGGGSESPAPTPTASNPPVTTSSVVENPYFTEVAGAFPDPTNNYWFFDTAHPTRPLNYDIHAAQVAGSTAVDLNNDGKMELLLTFHKGPGSDQLRASYVAEPCKSQTVIYELNDAGKFVDASEKYIEGTRDSKSCSGFIYSIIDINDDGLKDVFYSTNQEDGRNSDAGSEMSGYVVGYISQPNGKYKMYKAGQGKWYGSIAHGIDYYGKPFVTAAGYPNDLNAYRQNHKYMWNGANFNAVYDGILPGISPVSLNFYSTANKISDRMIQQTWFKGHLAAEGFYMENGAWYPTNHVTPVMKLLGQGESLIIHSGENKPVDVFEYKNKTILGGSVGGSLENLCTVNMGSEEPFVAGLYAIAVLKDAYVPGKVLKNDDFYWQVELSGFHIKDKQLHGYSLTIQGENNFHDYGRLQCIDVNKDGYTDLVMSIGAQNISEISRIYINQKDKSFKKLDIGDLTKFKLSKDVNKHMSEMADFDNDGIMDIVVYPDNVTNNKSLDGSIKFYKGTKSVQ